MERIPLNENSTAIVIGTGTEIIDFYTRHYPSELKALKWLGDYIECTPSKYYIVEESTKTGKCTIREFNCDEKVKVKLP